MKKYREIRLRHGKFDDIAIGDLHLERMDTNVWWLGYYQGKKRVSFFIQSKSKINVILGDDELNCKLVEQE